MKAPEPFTADELARLALLNTRCSKCGSQICGCGEPFVAGAVNREEREPYSELDRIHDAFRLVHVPGCATYRSFKNPCDCDSVEVAPHVRESARRH